MPNPRQLLRSLIRLHRWLGILLSPFIAVWFASGIVMMYASMPELTESERLRTLPELKLTSATLSPSQAARRVGIDGVGIDDGTLQISVSMVAGRPAYRFDDGERFVTVFADDGEIFLGYTQSQSMAVAVAAGESLPRYLGLIERGTPDQWTVEGIYQSAMPLHKVALADDEATILYVSDATGDIRLRSTRRSRAMAWIGAIPHWIYFRALRVHRDAWRQTVLWISGLATLLASIGLVIGWTRWKFSFFGWLRWHHLLGLCFGVTTFTWLLSGVLSLNPGEWSPPTTPSPVQTKQFMGGAWALDRFPALSGVLDCCDAPVKEIELIQFRGNPYYLVKSPRAAVLVEIRESQTPRLVELSETELLEAARAAMSDGPILDVRRLDSYDSYYYSRDGTRPLPVLRIRFNDESGTWLYIDQRRGRIAARMVARHRLNRWIYNGLHSFDFPVLRQNRPLWDIVVLGLLLGGLALSLTGTWMGFRSVQRWVRTFKLLLRRPPLTYRPP